MTQDNTNTYRFSGHLKFDPALKTTAAGKPFLPLTVEGGNATISVALFDEIATALAGQAQQGTPIIVQGTQNQRKDPQSGYWYNSAVCTAYSLDNGQSWVDQKSLRQHQFQTQQGAGNQQQPVNPQVAHIQQCQQQFQQTPAQPQQGQPQQHQQPQAPIQSIQPQVPAGRQAATQIKQAQQNQVTDRPGNIQAAAPASQQSREQFLNSNPYQNPPPSAAAVAAQQDLYSDNSKPQVGQPAQQPTPPAQPAKTLTDTDPFDDELLF